MKLYLKYFSIHIKSQMQHKVSFVLMFFGQLIISFSIFMTIYFMFSKFNQVDGFTYKEVLLCFSIVLASYSLAETFARGFDLFGNIISNGEFDRIMVRPRNEIFQVLATKVDLARTARFLQAVIILAFAMPTSGVNWSFYKIIVLIFMIIGGFFLFSGLFIVYASFCFFTTEGLEFMNAFTDGGREMGKYPISIYGTNILKFYTFVIPLACVQYYPLLYLLNRSSNVFLSITPIFGVLFLIPCYGFWKFGIMKYKSTGS